MKRNSPRKFPTKKVKYSWDVYFQEEVWNNNKYTVNKRQAVWYSLQLVKILKLPKLIESSLLESFQEVTKAQETFKNGEIDEAVDLIALECVKILRLFYEA